MQFFTKEHMHDLGKYVFGFSVFWTYLWFSQFLLIWYANNGEETQYFYIRFQQFPAVFYLNLFINFIIPFFALMMNSSKRAVGTLGFIAGLVVVGHWIDYYQMIKPGVWYNYEHAQHMAHEGHGDDGDHKDHEDGHSEKKHSSNDTYRLEDHNTPKATLTTYQDQHKDEDHAHEHENKTPETTATTSADDDGHGAAGHDDGHGAAGHDDGHGAAGHDDGHGAAGHDDGHGDHEEHAEEHEFVMGIHFPGFLELGTMFGFLGLFLFVTFSFLSQASLMPKNDPYVDESKHHHVWYDL
jgi:hypothetical protein